MASANHSEILSGMENILPKKDVAISAIKCPTNSLPRILVVDDEPDICRLNTEVLSECGYHVDAANDGTVAWHALNAGHYDLLIADNNMPTMMGLELIKKLRAGDMTLPVILMSGTMPEVDLASRPGLQIQATLNKPYTLVELLMTVRKVLHMNGGAHEQFAPAENQQNLQSVAALQS